jgi:hypothetical protein
LLLLNFKDFFLIIPFALFFIFFWLFFIRNNFFTVRINPQSSDVLKNSKFLKKVHYIFLMNWVQSNFFYFFIFMFYLKADFYNFWFNHLKISNFNYNFILLIVIISFFLINLIRFLKNSNVNYNIDYFTAIINLIIFVPLIFLSNTIYTFLFLLELNSLIILYKFSVSRTWFNNKNFNFSRTLPKSYLNMLFFQYWANFFSSMLIMFSIFNLMYIFGSTEWFLIEVLNNNFFFSKNLFFVYIWLFFFIGIFLKIGFTPLHLFKIEVYKGIPFLSIFFYTTWYFLSFFLYFIIIIFNNLNSLKYLFNLIFLTFIIIGLFYSLFLLFDINLLKSFFAYSTVVNAMNFMIVLYMILN